MLIELPCDNRVWMIGDPVGDDEETPKAVNS